MSTVTSSAAPRQLFDASNQWASRPDDQRFLTMADLKASVSQRKLESWTVAPACRDLRVIPTQDNDIVVDVYDPTQGERRQLIPTHWSFGQLASYAGAPAGYLRTLPAELGAINLQWGLEKSSVRDEALILGRTNGHDEFRAMTSTSYGRIWDHQVVEAVERVNLDGRWQIPAASYALASPKRATTLYASDRDVFIFLVDPQNPVEIPGEQHPMYRGFYTWNSEVGAQVFGLTTFLYRTICDNRIIWGATNVSELRIRHTGGAPDRFAREGSRYLQRYAQESTKALVDGITAAKAAQIPVNEGKGETVSDWLRTRGFTAAQAKASVETAQAEEGSARTVWDIVNGISAYARSIPHTDARIDLEAKAGKLMASFAA